MERLEGKTRYSQEDLQKFLDEGVDVLSNTPLATVPDRRFKIHRGQQGELFLRELLEDGVGLRTMEVPDAEGSPPAMLARSKEERKRKADASDAMKERDEAREEAAQARTQRDKHAKEELRVMDALKATERELAEANLRARRAQALHEKEDEIQERANRLAREMNQLQLNYAELTTERDHLQTEVHRLREDYRKERDLRQRVIQQSSEGADALEMFRRENNRLTQELRQARDTTNPRLVADMNVKMQAARMERDELRDRATAAEATVTDLDVETVRLKRELRELREERDKAQWERKRMQDALDLQTKRVGELETNPVPKPTEDRGPKCPGWIEDMMKPPTLEPTPQQTIATAVELMRQASKVTSFAAQLVNKAAENL